MKKQKKKLGKATKCLRRVKGKSSTILAVLGMIGVAVTGFLAAKAVPEAQEGIQRAKEDKAEELNQSSETGEVIMPDDVALTRSETVRAGGRAFIKAFIAGTLTIVCIAGSKIIDAKEITHLVKLYDSIATVHSKHIERTQEKVGKEKEAEIRKETYEAMANGDQWRHSGAWSERVIETGNGDQLFYDVWSDRYFRSSIPAIESAITILNKDLEYGNTSNVYSDHVLTLSDVYEAIGLPATKAADSLVWEVGTNNDRIILDLFTQCVTINGKSATIFDFSAPPSSSRRFGMFS